MEFNSGIREDRVIVRTKRSLKNKQSSRKVTGSLNCHLANAYLLFQRFVGIILELHKRCDCARRFVGVDLRHRYGRGGMNVPKACVQTRQYGQGTVSTEGRAGTARRRKKTTTQRK